jgi:hypothetical protein
MLMASRSSKTTAERICFRPAGPQGPGLRTFGGLLELLLELLLNSLLELLLELVPWRTVSVKGVDATFDPT